MSCFLDLRFQVLEGIFIGNRLCLNKITWLTREDKII